MSKKISEILDIKNWPPAWVIVFGPTLAVVVLFLLCLCVMLFFWGRPDPLTEYRAAQQEYQIAIQLAEKFAQDVAELRGKDYATQEYKHFSERFDIAKKQVEAARTRMDQAFNRSLNQ